MTAAGYDERLYVPLRWWVQGTMLVASMWLAMIVAIPPLLAWSLTALMAALLGGCLVAYGSARITVQGRGEDGVLRVGRAHIEGRYLGAASALDAEATRRSAGRDADARAFLMLRPFLKRAVKVTVTDPADPAPYWLVSTRRPEQLAVALGSLTGPVSPHRA